MEYHPSHKASSVASTSSNTSSIWGSLPSLYTGRADSVSSELDDFLLPDPDEGFSKEFIEGSKDDEKQEMMTDFNNKRCKEILSDEQRRVNHIASEQKRRNTIRGGFRELTELVPNLKNINNSKSIILFKSVEYIKQLDKRNKKLKDTLQLLQKRVKQRQLVKKKISYQSISIPSDNAYSSMPALIMPASVDDWLLNQSYTPSFNIPAMDNDHCITHGRESLLSSGKLNHLKQ